MKNVKISFKDLTLIVKQKTYVLFWIALVIVVLLELWVMQKVVNVALDARNNPAPEAANQTVRVYFPAFNEVLEKVETNTNYSAEPVPEGSPFGLPPQEIK